MVGFRQVDPDRASTLREEEHIGFRVRLEVPQHLGPAHDKGKKRRRVDRRPEKKKGVESVIKKAGPVTSSSTRTTPEFSRA